MFGLQNAGLGQIYGIGIKKRYSWHKLIKNREEGRFWGNVGPHG